MTVEADFLDWAASHGCRLTPGCELAEFSGMGRGLRAARDFEEDELLFTVHRRILLNLRTSRLGPFCQAQDSEWEDSIRNSGWVPLILSMLWEQWRVKETARWKAIAPTLAQPPAEAGSGAEVEWGPYLSILPTSFDTPMMWDPSEAEALLKGTDVLPRIGRKEADEIYVNLARPFIAARPHIFLGLAKDETTTELIDAEIEKYYSLNLFHIMGSRVLSRSFHVKTSQHSEDDGSDDEEEEEEEDTADISMVPMADMLNARHNSDNARLFFLPDALEMRTTSKIAAGSQIFNTFGDPPNGDLLRRYGHVDEPNGNDCVDLEVHLIGDAICELIEEATGKTGKDEKERSRMGDRVSWLCGGGDDDEDEPPLLDDDAFPLTYLPGFAPSPESPHATIPSDASDQKLAAALTNALEETGTLPEELLQAARVLSISESDFEAQVKRKHKLPSGKFISSVTRTDLSTAGSESGASFELSVASVMCRALRLRLRAYGSSSIAEDEAALKQIAHIAEDGSNSRERMALVVRLGEKRVLSDHLCAFEAVERSRQAKTSGEMTKSKKRKSEGQERTRQAEVPKKSKT
ncbi:Ribosomal lysine N-methyltransferase 4 [Tilletia horrida]|uniref:Ribosomal lysine N-methyltransferase 4 n=1 Tax=Tilletia horrida TaxID=155126 RepID=A0AAN6GLL2_9BASI|nr:Ribosomal lysine N-methyltransferase 4 [Tilletia horrida]KAK0561406.1 Ribosomal lysine N-methyltransferase 4 [Tilletia horrida]